MARLEDLSTKMLMLDISTNLSRIGRFALEGNEKRIKQFLDETDDYIKVLQNRTTPKRLDNTFNSFYKVVNTLKKADKYDKYFADDAFTYSNILMHRSKLAEN